MARHHQITIETVGTFTKFVKRSDNMSFDPLSDWPPEIDCSYSDKVLRLHEKPSYIDSIEESADGWKISVSLPVSIEGSIVTCDEEYKAWKLIDWDDCYGSPDDIQVHVDLKKSFKVSNHDSWHVDNDELDEIFPEDA